MTLNGSGVPSRGDIQTAIDEAGAKGTAAAALLGGLKVHTGTFTATVGTTQVTATATFPVAFSAAPTVLCTIIDTAAASSGHRVDRWGTSINDTVGQGDLTAFTFKSTRNSGSAAIRVNWLAIGAP